MSILFAATYPERVAGARLLAAAWRARPGPRTTRGPAARGAGRVRRRADPPALGRGRARRGRGAEPRRRPRGARVLRPDGAREREPGDDAAARRRCSSTSTCATSSRASTSRRSSCTAATTGWSTSATAAGSPSTCRTRGWSSCPATTTSRGTRRRRDRSARSRSSSPARATQPEPDRVLATVLFTDIVDSTQHGGRAGRPALARAARAATQRGGPRGARPLRRPRGEVDRRRLPRHLRRAGARRSGAPATIVESPQPARASRSAPALHTGECEVMGDDIGGIAVHIAARVSALAGPERGARLAHGQGPRRRLGDRVRGPRRPRAQGRARHLAAARGRLAEHLWWEHLENACEARAGRRARPGPRRHRRRRPRPSATCSWSATTGRARPTWSTRTRSSG